MSTKRTPEIGTIVVNNCVSSHRYFGIVLGGVDELRELKKTIDRVIEQGVGDLYAQIVFYPDGQETTFGMDSTDFHGNERVCVAGPNFIKDMAEALYENEHPKSDR